MDELEEIEPAPEPVVYAKRPLVAIVGRPNVGKSTLFNRCVGARTAIVGDEPGITRDRIYGEAEWNGRRFRVVDTGGIVPDDDALIPSNIFKQAGAAIAEAEALIWVVDIRAGSTSLDAELALLLRETGKRVLVAANKADAEKIEAGTADFYRFGFNSIYPISAEHANGVGDLLDELVEGLAPMEGEEAPDGPRELRLAIVGRPNVGKSSLLNRLLGEERVIVSPVAGTTRDSVDTTLTVDGQAFRIIDTAGIRRKGKTTEMAEKLSVIMAKKSLDRADVAILVIDAEDGVAGLDATIGGYAHDAGCSIIIAVNKWDAVPDKETGTPAQFERDMRDKMKFLEWAPVVMISALTGQRVTKILPLAIKANEARNRRIPTGLLNAFFEQAVSQPRGGSAPATVRGGLSRLRIKYMTQAGVRPPTFVLFTSGGKPGLHFSYTRYLMNRLREEFDFFATPLKLVERHKKDKKH
ncbi:MAG: ribosome biogenesis GTPase Der [Pyrinomonadaceae bacterium]